jgi:uncharacterized protein
MIDKNPPTYFAVFHTPGSGWDAEKSYDRQPGFPAHVQYMDECFNNGIVVLSGPFLERDGGMASGGMLILKSESLEEARAIAVADPTVKSGMLQVEVKPWAVVFHH